MTTQKAVMRVASICLKVIIFIVIVLGIVSLGQTTYRYTHAVFSGSRKNSGRCQWETVSEGTGRKWSD